MPICAATCAGMAPTCSGSCSSRRRRAAQRNGRQLAICAWITGPCAGHAWSAWLPHPVTMACSSWTWCWRTKRAACASPALFSSLAAIPSPAHGRWSRILAPATSPIITDAAILQLACPGLIDGQPLTLMHVEQFCWRYHRDFFTQHQFPFVEGLTPAELRMGSFPAHYSGTSSCAWAAVRSGAARRA